MKRSLGIAGISAIAISVVACGPKTSEQASVTMTSTELEASSLKASGALLAEEFVNGSSGSRILTSDKQVQDSLKVVGSGWQKSGFSFGLFSNPTAYPHLTAICSFYLASTNGYFYTAKAEECDAFKGIPAFQFRGIEGYALYTYPEQCPVELSPVYRLFKPDQGRHRYVADVNVVTELKLQGWSPEGVAFCVPDYQTPAEETTTTTTIRLTTTTTLPVTTTTTLSSTTTTTLPPTQPPAGVKCLDRPLFTVNSTDGYRKIYSTSTLSDRSHDQYRMLGNNTIWTIKLVVSGSDSSLGQAYPVGLNFGEAPAAQRAFRKVVISKSMCDMSSASNIVLATRSNSGAAELAINQEGRISSGGAGVLPNLTTGVYYINIQNNSCPTGQYCDALIEWVR